MKYTPLAYSCGMIKYLSAKVCNQNFVFLIVTFNVYQLIILVGLVPGIFYVLALLSVGSLRSRANTILALLIIAIIGNLGQYWLHDVGLISEIGLQLLFLPWQSCLAPLFLLYVMELLVFRRSMPAIGWLFAPTVILLLGHIIIKVMLLIQGPGSWTEPRWAHAFFQIEEYVSLGYCAVVSLIVFVVISREKKLTDYRGFGTSKQIVLWIRHLVLWGLAMCIVWPLSLASPVGAMLSSFYLLWIILVIVLHLLGINGIYYTLKYGPKIRNNIIVPHAMLSTDKDDAAPDSRLPVSTPTVYYRDQDLESIIALSSAMTDARHTDDVRAILKKWIMSTPDIRDVTFDNDQYQQTIISPDGRDLHVAYVDDEGEIYRYSIHAVREDYFDESHLYYYKMVARVYSSYFSKVNLRMHADRIAADNPLYPRLLKLFAEQKIHTNPDLSLTTVARMLEISPGYLSKLIRDIRQEGFNDMVNSYRIREAQDLMKNEADHQMTLMGYGYEAGFRSRSTFYKAFQKIAGITPGDYLRQV